MSVQGFPDQENRGNRHLGRDLIQMQLKAATAKADT
jgi:hypothetical protein